MGRDDLDIRYSNGLESWLAERDASLAFAVPPATLFFVGLDEEGGLSVFQRAFNKCMGLSVASTNTLYVGTRYQLWRFESHLRDGERRDGFDRCYVPRRVWTTGYVNCHDVAVTGDGEALFANTRFGCLARVSDSFSFEPVWWPPFQTRRTQGDCCHLNGIAMEDGRPAYVTSVSRTGELDSWRDHRVGGGVVTSVTTGEIVCEGMSMPHSPRLHGDRLWLTNSGTGHFGWADLDRGRFEPVAFAPGFLRGLTFVDDWAVVGSSRFRGGSLYSGLPLDDALAKAGTEPRLGFFIVDLTSGQLAEWLIIEGPMHELFDVVALRGVRRPMALGLIDDEIEHAIWFDSGELVRL
jgi:uncharacterized protein (TIGR03032 family)